MRIVNQVIAVLFLCSSISFAYISQDSTYRSLSPGTAVDMRAPTIEIDSLEDMKVIDSEGNSVEVESNSVDEEEQERGDESEEGNIAEDENIGKEENSEGSERELASIYPGESVSVPASADTAVTETGFQSLSPLDAAVKEKIGLEPDIRAERFVKVDISGQIMDEEGNPLGNILTSSGHGAIVTNNATVDYVVIDPSKGTSASPVIVGGLNTTGINSDGAFNLDFGELNKDFEVIITANYKGYENQTLRYKVSELPDSFDFILTKI